MKFVLRFLLLFCCIVATTATNAQQYKLSGKIIDIKGQAIPFANIYVKSTTLGTSSNIDGFYELTIAAGKTDLIFTSVGFEDRHLCLDVRADKVVEITLSPKIFTLNDVVINTEQPDRARKIIEKVITQRKTLLNEVDSYTCEVYTKAMQKLLHAPKRFFGRNVANILELDSNSQGVIYLSETSSKLDVQQKRLKEYMTSSKVAGDDNGFSFNKASDLNVNFYNNILFENKLCVRGFVSPVADNALNYYKYEFLGNSEQDGKTISKIKVMPKQENGPAFSGVVYVVNDSWRLNAVDLYLTQKNGIEFIDTLKISQQLVEIDSVYVPKSIRFNLTGQLFGFKFSGYVLGVFKNYSINQHFAKNFFSNEILKIDKIANRKDEKHWDEIRLVPLTTEEKINYGKKDSVALLKTSLKYLDSVDHIKNKFNPLQVLVTPYVYYRSYLKKAVFFDPLATSIFYNTVEGLAFKYAVNWRKAFEDGSAYNIKPEVRYGLGNNKFNANVKAKYTYDPIKNASLAVGIGSEVANLNSQIHTNLLRNSLNAILFGKNIAKFYQRNFVNIEFSREFAPSFSLKLTADYALRKALTNSSWESFNKNPNFTSNNPFNPNNQESLLFPRHNGLVLGGTLAYTIAQKYITRPDGRFYMESNFPKIEFNYKRGIDHLLGSNIDYNFISLDVYEKALSIGMLGRSSFSASVGKFITSKTIHYPDWKHFRANQSLVFDPDERNFQFLDFYIFSTKKKYFEAHFQHNFGSLLFNQIPLLKKLKLEEIIGSAYLTSPEKRNYNEFYFGVKRLNFRVHYGYAYDRDVLITKGFKFSYGLNL